MGLATGVFQSTRPIRGATSARTAAHGAGAYFNPRAPYGARPYRNLSNRRDTRYFNPRAPYGARPISSHGSWGTTEFQSSRPIRGATFYSSDGLPLISVFQSSRPIRGATQCAPSGSWRGGDFNPRAPYGARRGRNIPKDIYRYYFNPRAPYGARHDKDSKQDIEHRFQSSRPIRGATSKTRRVRKHRKHFNPRAPYGARPESCMLPLHHPAISILAPHTGRDNRENNSKGGNN